MLKLEAKIGDRNPKTVTVAIFDSLSALKKNISINVPINILKKCQWKILVLMLDFVRITKIKLTVKTPMDLIKVKNSLLIKDCKLWIKILLRENKIV